MAGPSRIAALGASCYGCHVVGEAELIAAGHPVPGPFDLAAKTQGTIRHNFVRGQGENAVASLERRRLLHVLGRLLDWSETLRGLAAAPEGSEAAARLSARAAELRVLVEGLHDAAPRPELASALAEGADAATIAAAAWALAAGCDGSELSGLDALLPPVPAD